MKSSYAHGTSLVALLGETIGASLEATTERFPDREVLVSRHQNLRYTYATFSQEVDLVARGLLARGVEVGDRVGIWSPNRSEWAVVQYATAKVGAILVTVNPAYRSAELAFVLRQSGMRTLVAASGFRGADYVAMLDAARADAPALTEVVILDDESYQALRSDGERVAPETLERRKAILDADQPINIQYTSGTTGFPKGATLSHHNILNNGFFVGEGCRYTEADRICVPVPYYHCFGMVMGNLAATTHGACVVLPAEGFDAAAVLETVSAERCTSLYGVPTMFIAELGDAAFPAANLSTLRTGIMAGSPCPVEVMRQVLEKMGMDEVTICYGMTETSPVSTQTSPEDSLEQRTGTVGRAHPHVEVKVIDPSTGLTVPRGKTGELCTRGYSVMLGYWDEPERTAEVLDHTRWMHTGDLATMDEAGYVNIVGRTKDMIIRGGENVYPREVEELLYEHPAIADVQVIGVPDARYGEVVMAWVQVRPGEELDAETLVGWCRERMAHFKVPTHVRFVESFPMTVTGKVQKYKMREQAIAELGLEEIAAQRTA